MGEDLKVEYFLLKIRDKLNNDKIKLWLPPYLSGEKSDDGTNFEVLEKLADKFSDDLKIDKNICLTALKELQKHALDKLHDKEVYQETGVAVIKVKLSGLICSNNNNNPAVVKILSIRISLTSFTNTLQEAVGEQISIPAERIKLISNGKVLTKSMTLESQGLKHGLQIMAVILNENLSEIQEFDKQVEILERMKDDVKLLANSISPMEDTFMEIADQSGKKLELPPEERRSLISAMALHEKGRVALKKEAYALALVFLLEADKAFSNCNSQLLNSVDNYGLLNLDIAWCYLCLKNVTQLPDAEKRLKICESKFKYSYGPNLERLVALKGSSGNEAALLMRLHLLQGIVLFHQNKHDEARKILKEAQQELSVLKVDDNSLSSLIEVGVSASEARIALRATKGCVNSAIEYIQRKKQEKEALIKKEKEEREKRKLGFCKDKKQYINPSLVTQLESMGFPRSTAVAALRQTNNDVYEAVSVIQQQPELFTPSSSPAALDSPIFKEILKQIEAMGYDTSLAKEALMNHNGDLRKAVEELLANEGIVTSLDGRPTCRGSNPNSCSNPVVLNGGQPLNSLKLHGKPKNENSKRAKKRKLSDDINGSSAGCSSSSNAGPSSSSSNPLAAITNKLCKRLKQEKDAFSRFSEGISTNVDDHLDLTLEQEEEFLAQYLSLLI